MNNPAPSNARDTEAHMVGLDDDTNEVGYTDEGWLNEYALCCGYMESVEIEKVNLTLWQPSPGNDQWDVRAHDHSAILGEGRIFWKSFDTLGEARQQFAQSYRHFTGQE